MSLLSKSFPPTKNGASSSCRCYRRPKTKREARSRKLLVRRRRSGIARRHKARLPGKSPSAASLGTHPNATGSRVEDTLRENKRLQRPTMCPPVQARGPASRQKQGRVVGARRKLAISPRWSLKMPIPEVSPSMLSCQAISEKAGRGTTASGARNRGPPQGTRTNDQRGRGGCSAGTANCATVSGGTREAGVLRD